MNLTTGIALYFLIWWITLFAVLPFGIKSQIEDNTVVSGSEPGAPALPKLKQKIIITTVVSSIIFTAMVATMQLNNLSLQQAVVWLSDRMPWMPSQIR